MVYAKSISGGCPQPQTTRRRVQVIYVQKMQERRLFFDELTQLRRDRVKYFFKVMRDAVGPIWYHALSVTQRCALDGLERSIYQDILEGIPHRTRKAIHRIGLYPPPKYIDLMAAIYAGEQDPMNLFAYLFQLKFGHIIAVKRLAYTLNAKLLLSSLFYLGLANLKNLLEETFKPDREEPPPKPKPKRKPSPPPVSPYLEKTVVKCYYPPPLKGPKPIPLPDLSELNKPVRPVEKVLKPPPPQKTITAGPRRPRDRCDRMAGVMVFQPFTAVPASPFKPFSNQNIRMPRRRIRHLSKINEKKQYGLNLTQVIKRDRHKKPKIPISYESQFQIVGIHTINEKPIFVLGNAVSLRVRGFLIHGGFFMVQGEYTRIHGGCTDGPQSEPIDPCDCLERYRDVALGYVKSTKCDCGHHYDYKNEGTFSSDEVPYFYKSSGKGSYRFNYDQIYELDSRALYIGKEFKRIWDTESLLADDDTKKTKKKKIHITSTTCLGDNPKLKDYLICALESYKTTNMAARLPDVHLAPELKEWIRRRFYGNFNRKQKKEMLLKSQDRWCMLKSAETHGFGHVFPPVDPVIFYGCSSWAKRKALRERFNRYYEAHRRHFYKVQVNINNLLWATMFHEQFPDRSFRDIFFSYLLERTQDFNLFHPYSTIEATERAMSMNNRRVVCSITK